MENDRGRLRADRQRVEEIDPTTDEVVDFVDDDTIDHQTVPGGGPREPVEDPTPTGGPYGPVGDPTPMGGPYRYLDSEPGEPPPVRGDTR